MDYFKEVNDTLGHSTGDLLLQIGDVDNATDATTKVLEALRRTFRVEGYEFQIFVSIGIALYPNNREDPETLIKKADAAMYRVKASGKDNFQFASIVDWRNHALTADAH
ncbi:MAG: GGDEF domain-containing protein [Chloroflexota bacterium]